MSSRGQLLVEAVNRAMGVHRTRLLANGSEERQDAADAMVEELPRLIDAVREYLADAPTDEIVDYMPVYPEFEERVSWPEVRDAAAAARGDYRFGRAL